MSGGIHPRVVVTMSRHSIMRGVGLIALVLSAWAPALPVAGQSLGDVARRESERRKTVKGPVAVFTNASLKTASTDTIPTPPGRPSSEPEQSAAAADASQPAAATPAPAAESAPDPSKDPEYWRKRISDARVERDRSAFLMEAMQSRINALWADFTARDDPAQRAVLFSDRQRAFAELDRLKKEQEALDKKIGDIEEEARRANVPPGWIR
jgi:hypothetical protein